MTRGGIVVHRELKRILAKAKLGLALTDDEKRTCATAREIIETIADEIRRTSQMKQELNGLCRDCPILNICRKEGYVGDCGDDERTRREMVREASYVSEQARGADYGNI